MKPPSCFLKFRILKSKLNKLNKQNREKRQLGLTTGTSLQFLLSHFCDLLESSNVTNIIGWVSPVERLTMVARHASTVNEIVG